MTGKRSKQQDCGYKRVLRVLAKLIARHAKRKSTKEKLLCKFILIFAM